MLFKQIKRNAAKSRKDNGIFFGSLIVAIIAFYTLLSLESQDVMVFLSKVESGAVEKLFQLIPAVFVVSLFFVFFLVYFAYRYQMNRRKKELGLYMMLGMKRRKLFLMLIGETLWNGMASLLIGGPIAIFLVEIISLMTSKFVGIGIIGHNFSFSLQALIITIIGFMAVQIIAMVFISVYFCRKEPKELLSSDAVEMQKEISVKRGWVYFILGIALLVTSYTIGITMLRGFALEIVGVVLLSCGIGTFLLYRGMSTFIGSRIKNAKSKKAGLSIFTGRQIQENVLHQHTSLAVSSLLLLVAMICVSYGIGVSTGSSELAVRSVDFSITAEEQQVKEFLSLEKNEQLVSAYYPMYLDNMSTDLYDENGDLVEATPGSHEISWEGLESEIRNLPETESREGLLQTLLYSKSSPYLISESSYNALQKAIGKESLDLGANEAALYRGVRVASHDDLLAKALDSGAYVEVDGQKINLKTKLYTDNVVADRGITLLNALIVPDELYNEWRNSDEPSEPFRWNLVLKQEVIDENGLMQSIQLMNDNLYSSGLEYESFLAGMGRNLFYTVAASYLTIYMGILFMLIANTVIGLKYLMQQRTNERRFLTLMMLGTKVNEICKSATKQIRLFFLLVISVTILSSVFAMWAMFSSFLKLPDGASFNTVILFSVIAFAIFLVIELIYINVVVRTSNREIRSLSVTNRG